MRSTPFICCSIGVATDCSIVSASAPVYVVVRLICGGRICGNCAIGGPSSETTPSSTVTIAITIATIGRRMQNSDMRHLPWPEADPDGAAEPAAGVAEPAEPAEPAAGVAAPAAEPAPAGGAAVGTTIAPSCTRCRPST